MEHIKVIPIMIVRNVFDGWNPANRNEASLEQLYHDVDLHVYIKARRCE